MSEVEQPVYVSDQVREVERLHHDLLTDTVRRLPIREQLDQQAERIVEGHKAGDRAVVTHITCWHPTLVCHSAEDIMGGDFTLDDARQTIAREYGYADWSDVEARGSSPPDPSFELAVDTLLRGDVGKLRGLLANDPSLIHRRSSFGHRSTLLHYVGSNGVETYRQRVPINLAEITRLLVKAGADVNATAEMYGGGVHDARPARHERPSCQGRRHGRSAESSRGCRCEGRMNHDTQSVYCDQQQLVSAPEAQGRK